MEESRHTPVEIVPHQDLHKQLVSQTFMSNQEGLVEYYARKLRLPREEVQDIAGDVMERIITKMDYGYELTDVHRPAPGRALIFRSIYNGVIDYKRRNKVVQFIEPFHNAETQDSDQVTNPLDTFSLGLDPTADEVISNEEELRKTQLMQGIMDEFQHHISERYFTVFALGMQGMRIKDIALTMSTPSKKENESTIKTIFFRAKKELIRLTTEDESLKEKVEELKDLFTY